MKLVLYELHPYFSTYSTFLSMFHLQIRSCNLPRKILLTLLWATSLLQFLLPRHWHNACLFNPLTCGRKYDSLVSMEDGVKLSTRMRWLSSLSWCLRVFEPCHTDGEHNRFARFVSMLRNSDVIQQKSASFWFDICSCVSKRKKYYFLTHPRIYIYIYTCVWVCVSEWSDKGWLRVQQLLINFTT